jgi:ankyrin repeat protein
MTGTGMSIGSPAYMSPEQIQASEIDGQSDQFALAVIAFQMLAGRMPFRGTTAVTLMYQIVTADPFDPQSGDIPLSREVRAVLARALAKKPQDRFADCATFIQQLTDTAGAAVALSQAETLRVDPLPAPRTQDSRSWMIGPILGGILTLGLLGAGIYHYFLKPVPVAPVRVAESTPTPAPIVTPAPIITPAPTAEPTPTPAPVKAANEAKPGTVKKPAAPSMTLTAAVTNGKIDVVKALLGHGANVNEADADGNTPLMIASEGTPNLPYNLPVVQMLIAAHASLEARDARGRTALHRASAEGQASVVRVLLDSGALIEARANDGSTPLLQAVEFGKMAVVQLLLERKAHVDAADTSETTPLMIASEGNSYLPISAPMVEALLAAHAHVNAVDAAGRTALYRASITGKPEPARLLLDHGAKVNLAAKDGTTPLIEAVTFGRILVVQVLLNHHAEVDQADAHGETSLMIAAAAPRHPKDSARILKLLLDHGAKRGLKDQKGHTALDRAKESKNAAAVELLK